MVSFKRQSHNLQKNEYKFEVHKFITNDNDIRYENINR